MRMADQQHAGGKNMSSPAQDDAGEREMSPGPRTRHGVQRVLVGRPAGIQLGRVVGGRVAAEGGRLVGLPLARAVLLQVAGGQGTTPRVSSSVHQETPSERLCFSP